MNTTDERKSSHRRPLRIAFMTTVHHNVGDEFIREGIRSFLDEAVGQYDSYYVNKHDLATLHQPLLDEPELLADKFRDADIIVQAGAPVYWALGPYCCHNVEWAQGLWYDRIFKLGPKLPVLNLGAGSTQATEEELRPLLDDPKCIDFARQAAAACRWTTVRDPLASRFLTSIGIKHDVLACPAFHAARRIGAGVSPAPRDWLAINLMPTAGHFELKPQDPEHWPRIARDVVVALRKRHRLLFVAHDKREADFQSAFAEPGERVFVSGDYRDYISLYSRVKGIVANRVHGAVCVAGFGRPAVIVGNDSRIGIARPLDIPARDSNDATADWIVDSLEQQLRNSNTTREKQIELRERSAQQYVEGIRKALL